MPDSRVHVATRPRIFLPYDPCTTFETFYWRSFGIHNCIRSLERFMSHLDLGRLAVLAIGTLHACLGKRNAGHKSASTMAFDLEHTMGFIITITVRT